MSTSFSVPTSTMSEYAVGLLTLYMLDLAWINSPPIKQAWNITVRSIQGSPMVPNMTWAILAYIAMGVALTCIAIPFAQTQITSTDLLTVIYNALRIGGLVGFVIYTVFDATNGAIFSAYSLSLAVIDIVWGTLVFGLATTAALLFKYR